MDLASFGAVASFLVEVGKVLVPVAIGLGAAYRWVKPRYDAFINRQFDHWLVSMTMVSEPDADGVRTLMLRNLGSPEIFEHAVRGNTVRQRMLAAARRCSWELGNRFVICDSPEHQEEAIEATRNALTKYWQDGVRAKAARLPTQDTVFTFSVTGADAQVNGVKKFRVVVMSESDLVVVSSHPAAKWQFEVDHHKLRLDTVRRMAVAHLTQSGCVHRGGAAFRIVGTLEGSERV